MGKQTDLLPQVKENYAKEHYPNYPDWDHFISDTPFHQREFHYDQVAEAYHAARIQEQGECFTDDDELNYILSHVPEAAYVAMKTFIYGHLNRIAAEHAAHQNRELIAWKESAQKIFNEIDLQAIGKELGVPLGQSVSENLRQMIQDYAEGKVAEALAVVMKEGLFAQDKEKEYQIDFDGNVLVGLRIKGSIEGIVGAMNGYGINIPVDKIIINQIKKSK